MNATEIAAVTELLEVAAAVDGRQPLSDHLQLDLLSGGGHGFAGFLLNTAHQAGLAAYAQLSRSNESTVFELVIHPEHRGQLPEITEELLAGALGATAERGGGRVNWWLFQPTDADRHIAEDAGMRADRTLFQMHRQLPTGIDATITTRPIVAADDEAWLGVNNRAFAEHGEQGGWTIDTLQQRRAEEWFDPQGFLIHERDGQMAGFCWTKVHGSSTEHPENRVGEIYVIAVDPGFHGLGLGKQLTLAGLEYLATLGITRAMLYVDANNVAAVGLYERLGFSVSTTTVGYLINVDPQTRSTP